MMHDSTAEHGQRSFPVFQRKHLEKRSERARPKRLGQSCMQGMKHEAEKGENVEIAREPI
jgi:hypothetical protein